VIILTREKSIITDKKYPKYEEHRGIKFYRWSNYLNLFALYRKIIIKEKIKVIHIFSKGLRPPLYLWFLKNVIKKPVIFSSIGFPNTEEDPQEKFVSDKALQKKLFKFIKNVDVFVVTSKYLFEHTPFFKEKNCIYLPYGIDIERFSRKQNKSNKKRELNIAYLRSPSKGLLTAFQKILDSSPKICFIFNNRYVKKNEELKMFVKKNEKRIKLIPDLKDISLFFNDVGIVVDLHDNKKYLECASPPLLILEAMACETKVISTNIGEIKEVVIDDKNGFLTKENTPEQVYLKIKKALKMNRNVEKNARKTIIERYDIKKVIKLYEELYRKINKCSL
jgi:glycosyltransferase involved in cell wall biosynthesis